MTQSQAAKDPVCGMDVDPSSATQKFEHQGTTYYFCSPGCRKSFEAEPQKYLAPGYKASM